MSWFNKKKPSIQQELLELKAKLARYELTPESDFTIYRSPYQGGIIHGVDRKPNEIARIKARIAELEVLATNEREG